MPGQPSPPTPRLETRNLTRRFGALVANDHVSLSVRPGELHCLLGENGAGKSTFSACLYGLDQSNEGEIFVNGKAVHIDSPADAIALGIAMVHQHFVLVPAFTVLENIIAGTGSGIALKLAAARRRIGELMVRIGLSLDLDRRVADLSVGECQWVEIVKALYQDVSLLILDEPTAVLTPQESDKLFAILRELKGRGISIILISHKMAEVMQSDRISVLRKGRLVATVETAATTRDELTMMMVGRVVKSVAASARQTDGPPVLSVSDLALPVGAATHPPRVSFDLRAGEVLGIAGIAGNGQDELLEMIAGVRPVSHGGIRLGGTSIAGLSRRSIAARGVGYVPADRYRDGLVGEFSIAENLILGQQGARRWRRGAFLDRARIASRAQDAIASYAIAAPGPETESRRLSGGNAQKVILAREFERAAVLLLCNQPTRGVDVSAIEFIHGELVKKRDEGCAVVLVSEELDDLLALADRIAVMFRGEIMGVFPRDQADIGNIGLLMAGTAARAS